MDIDAFLKERFGYKAFRAGQKEVILDVLQQKNQIAILPTGSGKSLCYQLPAYLMEGTVLIISPLVALMEDQVAILKQQGEKRVTALNSFYTYQERATTLRSLHQYKFVFLSPEMLAVPQVAHRIRQLNIAFIVVDEAHCISQWGFDFRPDYLRLSDWLNTLNNPTILALTATANEKVVDDIATYLNLKSYTVHRSSLDRKNIAYAIFQVQSEEEKTAWLQERLCKTTGPGIIYVASRKRADELVALLQNTGLVIAAYHAGMENEDRAFIQSQFLAGEIDWICSTNAFGMGVHKDDVRQVIHEHIPSTMANYIQEVGRAGRDGKPSIATLLYSEEDIHKTRFIIHESTPQQNQIDYFHTLLQEHYPLQEAAQMANVSETGTRMLVYYLEKQSLEETKRQIASQSMEKEHELKKMIAFLESDACIRKSILSFFGEVLIEKNLHCCQNCHPLSLDGFHREEKKQNVRKENDWMTRLDKLLGSTHEDDLLLR